MPKFTFDMSLNFVATIKADSAEEAESMLETMDANVQVADGFLESMGDADIEVHSQIGAE